MTRENPFSVLTDAVPLYVRRVVSVGSEGSATALVAADLELLRHCGNLDPDTAAGLRMVDAVVFSRMPADAQELAQARRILHPQGVVVALAAQEERTALDTLLKDSRLEPYQVSRDQSLPEGEGSCAVLAVNKEYDPLAHARALLTSGSAGLAFAVLSMIPDVYLEEPEVMALVAAEKALCLLEWESRVQDGGTVERFHIVQAKFFEATSRVTLTRQAYHCYAEFWHHLGDDDMATRLLRSIQYIAPDPATADQMAAYDVSAQPERPTPVPPAWTCPQKKPRILFITDDRVNHGLDVLFDGLTQVLGSGNVVDFPQKPTLHGSQPERFGYYPCLFNHPIHTPPVEELKDQLRQGAFDIVLLGDSERVHDQELIRQIMEAAQGTPVFLLDMLDNLRDNRPVMLQHAGLDAFAGYFKREMVACVDYGVDTFPLPFAYPDSYLTDSKVHDRDIPVFWAGNRAYGTRKLYLEYLEQAHSLDFSTLYGPEDYVGLLDRALIGLDMPGFGFDTVRYWEVPAHGGMLLTERRPTLIPFNFEHGVSAVYYDDLPDLEAKLLHYMAHPSEAQSIAAAGTALLREHHTGSARARHLLGWVQHVLGR